MSGFLASPEDEEKEFKDVVDSASESMSSDLMSEVALDPSTLNLAGGVWHNLWRKHRVRGQINLCVNYFSFDDIRMEYVIVSFEFVFVESRQRFFIMWLCDSF